jgi:hypothetical protein
MVKQNQDTKGNKITAGEFSPAEENPGKDGKYVTGKLRGNCWGIHIRWKKFQYEDIVRKGLFARGEDVRIC